MPTRKFFNFVLFQVGWFACVLSSAAGQPYIGALIALAIIGWHIQQSMFPKRELILIVSAMVLGAVFDSLLVWKSLLTYDSGILLPDTAPYWIVIMWALFATTLNLSLSWLKHHPMLAIVLGAIAGPLAYFAGMRIGALGVPDPMRAFSVLAIGWAVFTPLLTRLAWRFNGYARLAGEQV